MRWSDDNRRVGRRGFLTGGFAVVSALAAPAVLRAQPAPRARTPAQTAGPFYPTTLPADRDNDLVVLRGAEARAEGVVTHIGGRVLERDGRALAGAVIGVATALCSRWWTRVYVAELRDAA